MRSHLTDIIDTEMAAVVDNLMEARLATGPDRDAKFVELRRQVRQIVVRLSVERQTLLRRLKTAELSEQCRQLVTAQSDVRDRTAALPALPDVRRDQSALRALEDQRDANGLYKRLLAVLNDVRTWDGPVSQSAVRGLKTLEDGNVAQELLESEASLLSADFNGALPHQEHALASMRKLLTDLERAQGSATEASTAAAEQIRKIREHQERLREQIAEQGLTQTPTPEIGGSPATCWQRFANGRHATARRAGHYHSGGPGRRGCT